jgi:glycosyltransferase involved in cell wall biosynthesis
MQRTPVHPANLGALLRIRRLIGRTRPAVIHGHSSIGGALARTAVLGTSLPVVYTPNGIAEGRAARSIERLLGHRTNRFVAVCQGEALVARQLVPEGIIEVIPNGIDLAAPGRSPTDLRSDFGLAPDTPVVGTVSRLVAQKAPEQFVAVAAALAIRRPDVHFVLIGMGPLQSALDTAVADAGLRARFHQVPHLPDAAAILEQFDVFVLPSLFEGAPYAPLEAMRSGVPVVLSDVVGNHDTIEHEHSGLLYPFGDSAAMAAGIERLLSDEAWRTQLVSTAHQRLRSVFDATLMGQALTRVYRELASRRP